jgi:NAD(P)-dependent dehydrogenase (short-subunit alcohol dehydrogenase family)
VTGLLKDRIALVTGASRGIGQAVAKRYAAEGAQVILVGRDMRGLEETDDAIHKHGGKATIAQLDLLDPVKIEELALTVHQRFGKLDILVGNAGVLGEITPIAHSSPEEWNKTFAVNVTANLLLICAFDPLLKSSDAPRALFVTSGITEGVVPYWNAYAASKTTLETMVNMYAAENIKTPLKVNLITPGVVRTRMRAQAMPGEDPDTLTPADAITDLFVKLAGVGFTVTGRKFHAQ